MKPFSTIFVHYFLNPVSVVYHAPEVITEGPLADHVLSLVAKDVYLLPALHDEVRTLLLLRRIHPKLSLTTSLSL
jgi:hypothetical protein